MTELTPMQAACWFGRNTRGALGGVAAHLYVEFDGRDLDPAKLRQALVRICAQHPMLRLRVDDEGRQTVMPQEASPALEVEDFRLLTGDDAAQRLLEKRELWTHQRLDLQAGQAARFSLSLLGGGVCRLHVDTDMIAIDPPSFCVLMEDLAGWYLHPERQLGSIPGWFDWCEQMRNDPGLRAIREKDRLYWQARLADIPPPPALPLAAALAEEARSHRLATVLPTEVHLALKHIARSRSITLSTLMLGLFSLVLARHTGDRRFRLNVPMFWRNPLVADVERIVGDFANVLILGVETAGAESPATLCDRLGEQMRELLAHSAYPGVNLMRDLSRRCGDTQLAPVVVTAALDLPGGALLSPNVKEVFGEMNWAISQGPQVALDAQFAALDSGLLINWDIRLDALPQAWITAAFEDFTATVRRIAAAPQEFDRPMLAPVDRRPAHGQPAGESMSRRVLAIYLQVLAVGDGALADGRSDFISLGLRPRHLSVIASRLNEAFGTALPVAQLLRCRNADDVVQLLDAAASPQ